MTKRKIEKAKKRRKDYEKKRNVAKNKGQAGRLIAGDGVLPASKKNRLSKAEATRRKKAAGNIIKTATSR